MFKTSGRQSLIVATGLAGLALVGLVVALGTIAGARDVDVSDRAGLPTKLPFELDERGQIIPESVPDTMGVAGPDGNISQHLTREEYLELISRPPGPPGSFADDEGMVGPRPDQSVLIEESADGRIVTTVKDSRGQVISRTESSR